VIARIHHRVRLVIEPGDDADAAAAFIRPAPNDVLRSWPVYRPSGVAFGPRAVNDVRRDVPELLEPIEQRGA
jgi:putative SOS response-associated peptidase YedK